MPDAYCCNVARYTVNCPDGPMHSSRCANPSAPVAEVESGGDMEAPEAREWWLCPDCCRTWTLDTVPAESSGHQIPDGFDVDRCEGQPVKVREVTDAHA